jgi:hypothetical protein
MLHFIIGMVFIISSVAMALVAMVRCDALS